MGLYSEEIVERFLGGDSSSPHRTYQYDSMQGMKWDAIRAIIRHLNKSSRTVQISRDALKSRFFGCQGIEKLRELPLEDGVYICGAFYGAVHVGGHCFVLHVEGESKLVWDGLESMPLGLYGSWVRDWSFVRRVDTECKICLEELGPEKSFRGSLMCQHLLHGSTNQRVVRITQYK